MGTTVRSNKLKVVSLFCGCGGMDLGIQGGFEFLNKRYKKLPFEVVYAVDNDSYATTIYNDNFKHKAIVKDVREINLEEVPDHDILLGGFPCQSFSIIAQNPPRLGYKDEKGKLFFEMVRILKAKRPRFFIGENVKGLLSANNKKAFPMIVDEFAKAKFEAIKEIGDNLDKGAKEFAKKYIPGGDSLVDWHQNIKEYIKDEKETETEEHKNNPSDFKAPPAPKI